MTTTPGVVVVGTGFGVLTHVPALRNAGLEAVALVGRDPAKTAARAEMFGVPVACTSLGDALAAPDVHAVAIATPPHTHCDLALQAIAAGKHVVCEKPFARDAEEAQRMLDAAEEAGVIHLMGCEFRFATDQALATRAVLDGVIGQPRHATFVFHMPLLSSPDAGVPSWWRSAEDGGGWLGAYGSHVIDHVQTMLGPMTSVSASLTNVVDRGWTAEDTYTVQFQTTSGAEGVLQSSAAALGPFVSIARVTGTGGTLWIEGGAVHVEDGDGARQLSTPADLQLPTPVPPPAELMHNEYDLLHSTGIDLAPYSRIYETLAARMRGEQGPTDPVPATFADGVAIQKVLDACRRSASEHRAVALT